MRGYHFHVKTIIDIKIMSWVNTDEGRDLYAEARGKGADEIVLATERSTIKFLEAKNSTSAGKFTFQSHFSPAIKFEYIYYILFDMLSLFSRALPSRSRPQAELLFLL
jgi:hypothetical protein